MIRDEEGLDEIDERANIHSNIAQKTKVVVKNFNLPQLYQYFREQRQDLIVQQLQ